MTRTRGRFAGLVGSRILAIADEVRALQAGGRQICNLSIGDFDPREFPIPRLLLERIEAALRRGETNYPPSVGIPALREQISALYARELGLAIPASSIVITGGSRPALFAAYQLTVEPGDRLEPAEGAWHARASRTVRPLDVHAFTRQAARSSRAHACCVRRRECR